MIQYENRASGVAAYDYGFDYIKVKFKTGKTYLYTHRSCGYDHVDNMIQLAIGNSGLNSYINAFNTLAQNGTGETGKEHKIFIGKVSDVTAVWYGKRKCKTRLSQMRFYTS